MIKSWVKEKAETCMISTWFPLPVVSNLNIQVQTYIGVSCVYELAEKERGTFWSSISEGETGGLSLREPFKGPLLCESLPDVLGDTSCCLN